MQSVQVQTFETSRGWNRRNVPFVRVHRIQKLIQNEAPLGPVAAHICIIEEVHMAQPYIGYFCDHQLALNYNARATADSASRLIPASGLIAAPWSCIFPRYICNDVTAANWVSNATRMDVQGVSIRPIAIPALCRYGGCTDLTVRRGV